MADIRMERLADVLVNYSTRVQPGDWVGVLGDVSSLPILRLVHRKVVEAGGFPSLILNADVMARNLLRHGNDEQLRWLDPSLSAYYDAADVYIRVNGPSNTRA